MERLHLIKIDPTRPADPWLSALWGVREIPEIVIYRDAYPNALPMGWVIVWHPGAMPSGTISPELLLDIEAGNEDWFAELCGQVFQTRRDALKALNAAWALREEDSCTA